MIHIAADKIASKVKEIISWDNTTAVPGILSKHIILYNDGSLELLNAESKTGKIQYFK